jgi:serine/threonine protein kinase
MNGSSNQQRACAVSADDPLVAQALKEYLAALEAGTKPDREEFAARFPQIAIELRDRLAGLDFIEGAASELRPSAADNDAEQPLIERRLGDFRILREIGRGGMCIVYEAIQVSLGRHVALKVLPYASTLDGKLLQRFKNEAQAAAQLHHSNIVPVYAVGCERGVHYFAMQFVDGQTLAAALDDIRRKSGLDNPERSEQKTLCVTLVQPAVDNGDGMPASVEFILSTGDSSIDAQPECGSDSQSSFRLSAEHAARNGTYYRTVARIGIEAALALEHAHQLGVVHRDVKPGNLMLDTLGHLWVTDFGLARLPSETGLTATGDLVGTLRYMSPEQALARRGLIDQRTDVYSLGVTLYELVTLQPAFPGADREEVLRKIAFEEPAAPRRLNRDIPVDLETILLRAMTKEPAGRYQTAQEIADDLERFLHDQPVRARRPSLLQKIAKWHRRHWSVVTATVSMALLGLAFSAWFFWRGQVQTREQQRQAEALQQRAEDRAELARQALDEMYEQSRRWFSTEPWGAVDQYKFLTKVSNFYEEFAPEQGPSPTGRQRSAEAYHRIAEIHSTFSEWQKAEPAVDRAIGLFKGLVEEFPEERRYRRGLANCQTTRGKILVGLSRGPEAVTELAKAASALELLSAKGQGSAGELTELGKCQYQLGLFLATQMRRDDANRAFLRAQELFAELVAESPSQPDYVNNLAAVYVHRGKLLLESERAAEAERPLRDGLNLLKKLAVDSMLLPEFRQELGTAYAVFGDLLWNTGRPREAEESYGLAQTAYEKLVEAFPHVARFQGNLANTQVSLVALLRGKGDLKAARSLAEAAIHHQDAALRASPDRGDFQFSLQKLNRQLAGVCIDQSDYQQAATAGDRVANIVPYCPWGAEYAMQIFAALPALVDRDPKISDAERKKLVHKYLAREKELHQAVVQRGGGYAMFLNDLAWHLVTFPDARVRDPGQAAQLAEKAVAQSPKAGEMWNTLGVARYRQDNWKAAVDALKKASELNRGREASDYFFLAMAHWRLGEKDKACRFYWKGIRVMRENPRSKQTWQPFRSEAEALLKPSGGLVQGLKLPSIVPPNLACQSC